METFQSLVNGFLHASEAKASWVVYRRLADRHFHQWAAHPTFAEIEDWHTSLRDRPHAENKGLTLLKAAYTWGMRQGLHPGPNSASGGRCHPTNSRERVMTTEEIHRLLAHLDTVPDKLRAILLVLLLTGCRLSEARTMQWQHVNLDTGAWNQPHTKNGRTPTTYLPTQARAALAQIPRTSDHRI